MIKLSIQQARELLPKDEKLSDTEVQEVIENFYKLSLIIIENFIHDKKLKKSVNSRQTNNDESTMNTS